MANPRKLRAIYENDRKSDERDAWMLARLARVDPSLLHPIEHSTEEAQRDLLQVKLRDNLVRQRVDIVSSVRFTLKALFSGVFWGQAAFLDTRGFDNTIYHSVRLRIMLSLSTFDAEDSVDFTYLKKLLQLTGGNLGSHLDNLEQNGYLEANKSSEGKKQKTFLKMTLAGRAAYQRHRKALEKLLQNPEGQSG